MKHEELVNRLRQEEDLIVHHLRKCEVARIKYDVLTLEMPQYVEQEPTFYNKDYEYLNMVEISDIPKRFKKHSNKYPVPETFHFIYNYRSKTTGNIATMSSSSKPECDPKKMQYAPLLATFRSGNTNICIRDILTFILPSMKQQYLRIKNMKDYRERNPEYADKVYLQYEEFKMYYAEPCIDITAPKETIDFLHKNLLHNLYITRFSKRRSEGGKQCKDRNRKDGRILNDEDPTHYIGKRARVYRFRKHGKYYLRFELRFNKAFLSSKHLTAFDNYAENSLPIDFWLSRCFFFMFNFPKIKDTLIRKLPDRADSMMEYLTEKQFKEDGTEILDCEKIKELMKLKANGKKVFRSAKDILVPKWLTLHKLIADALSELSLNGQPSKVIIPTPVNIEIKVRTRGARRKIEEAVNLLKQKGEKITYKRIKEVTGIGSDETIADNKDLLDAA